MAAEGFRLTLSDAVAAVRSTTWVELLLGLLLLAFFWIYVNAGAHDRRKGEFQVPPGALWQIPLLGETIQLLGASLDDFVLPRLAKYGRTFRTHLLGHPSICTTSLEATKFVLQSSKLFEAGYPPTFLGLLGANSIGVVEGEIHDVYRRAIQSRLTPDGLRKIAPQIDAVATEVVRAWGDKETVVSLHEIEKFSFHSMLRVVCDSLSAQSGETDEMCAVFQRIMDGLMSLSNPFPWTAYGKAIRARKQINRFLQRMITQRRLEAELGAGTTEHADILQSLLNAQTAAGTKLTDAQIMDNLLTVLVAGRDTTGAATTWIVHSLLLYPKVFQQVQAENDALARSRQTNLKHVDDPLTVDEVRSLRYTAQVIQEVMRLNTTAFLYRRAKEDVIYDGMLFPKGWKVLAWMRYFHLDSQYFKDPLKFDPSRFETPPKTNTFTPFGNGARTCPGSELAKQEMLVFLYRLITTYHFEPAGVLDMRVINWPQPLPQSGVPIRITRRLASPGN